jgi:hypothetical protein
MSVSELRAPYSYASLALGAIALVTALVSVFAGPFTPQPATGVAIGELAAEIREAAQRALSGEAQPEPQVAPWDIDRFLAVAVPALGVTGLLLAITGFIRREPHRATLCATLICVGAMMAQFVLWAVLVIAGAIIIAAVLHNIGDILGT